MARNNWNLVSNSNAESLKSWNLRVCMKFAHSYIWSHHLNEGDIPFPHAHSRAHCLTRVTMKNIENFIIFLILWLLWWLENHKKWPTSHFKNFKAPPRIRIIFSQPPPFAEVKKKLKAPSQQIPSPSPLGYSMTCIVAFTITVHARFRKFDSSEIHWTMSQMMCSNNFWQKRCSSWLKWCHDLVCSSTISNYGFLRR